MTDPDIMVWGNAQPDYRQTQITLSATMETPNPYLCLSSLQNIQWVLWALKDRFFRSLSLRTSQGGHVNNQFPFTPLPLNDSCLSKISDQALFIGIPWGQNSMMSYQNSRDLVFTHRYATIFVCPEPVVLFPWFSTVSFIQWNKNILPRLVIKVF